MKVLCIFVSLVVATKADNSKEVRIPPATSMKPLNDGDKMTTEVPEMEARIVGGQVAQVGAHPYLVGLIVEKVSRLQTVCGSTLVSDTRLVTAAHCVDTARKMTAVLGSRFLFYGGTRIETDVFVKHPLYGRGFGFAFDVAVVALPRPVEFSAHIHPISLPWTPEDAEFVGEWAMAVGYGRTSDAQQSVKLRTEVSEVYLKVLPDKVCEKEYGSTFVPETWVCTSGKGGVGTCGGDSGGPLIVERQGRRILVGLTSFGDTLCEISRPSVFTRVATYLDFISQYL